MLREDDEDEGNKFESFAKQLQCIQESQDAILADIRMDMEQLQMDNLALRQSNAKLLAEKNHWEELYHEMSKNAKIMREHIQNSKYSIPSECSLKKSSSRSVSIHHSHESAHRSSDRTPSPHRSRRLETLEKAGNTRDAVDTVPKKRSRRRTSTSSQVSLGESTASEETQCDGRSFSHHSSRSKSQSRNSSASIKKRKAKHGCFDFLRKKSRQNRLE